MVRRALTIRPPMRASLMRSASAMRGWVSDAYSVMFQPINMFAIQEERLPDGQVLTLSTYWIEQPQPLQ